MNSWYAMNEWMCVCAVGLNGCIDDWCELPDQRIYFGCNKSIIAPTTRQHQRQHICQSNRT